MWVIAPWLVVAVIYGFCWGWDYGLRKGRAQGRAEGDRAHIACHEAQEAVMKQIRETLLASVQEHMDIEAWEDEL